MHPTKQTQETKESLYYSRVEPHIGHLQRELKHEPHNDTSNGIQPAASMD
jgi:hypothetical protein